MAISQHGTSVLFTSHPKDRWVVNLYIPYNRRTPLQAEEALGPISIPRGWPLLEDSGGETWCLFYPRHTLWEGGHTFIVNKVIVRFTFKNWITFANISILPKLEVSFKNSFEEDVFIQLKWKQIHKFWISQTFPRSCSIISTFDKKNFLHCLMTSYRRTINAMVSSIRYDKQTCVVFCSPFHKNSYDKKLS